ncbi:hypothetical protein KAR91_30340 [Candidatus Pacearchaeota archaeon]|nr:hypothetical protein [Candidatus Pacearchaeota archaeon]
MDTQEKRTAADFSDLIKKQHSLDDEKGIPISGRIMELSHEIWYDACHKACHESPKINFVNRDLGALRGYRVNFI